jgi:4-amino-4-deoxy-L-arabinose transferase-like glycosyltransferase
VSLLLQLAAVALGGVAQTLVVSRPWWSAATFALAAALFAAGARGAPSEAAPAIGARPRRLPSFWLLFTVALALCAAAAAGVRLKAAPPLTHGLWLSGLSLLVAGAIRADWGLWRWPRRTDLLACGVLLLVCAGMFGWQLTEVPPEVHGDEAEVGIDALRLLEERPFNLFRTSWFDLPLFHALPTALGLKLFGVSLLGLRATSAVLGTLTVLLLYGLARRLWGREVAFLAALLLASARFYIHLSRAGYHYVDTPLLSVLALLLALMAWRELRIGAAVWCGIALGLGVQTYYASRLVPPLLALTWLIWMSHSGREERRARGVIFAVLVAAALGSAAPMISYFSFHWDELWLRTSATSILSAQTWQHVSYGNPGASFAEVLLRHLQKALTIFNVTGDTSLQYGYRAPLFEPISAVLFVLGLACAGMALSAPAQQLLVLWILIPLVAGAALTIDAPFFPRISGILPFVAVVIALPLHRLLGTIESAAGGKRGRACAVAAVALCLIAIAAVNARTYFFDYAPRHRHGPAADVARWIRSHGAGRTTYMLSGEPFISVRHGAIRFLAHGYTTHDVTNLEEYTAQRRFEPGSSFVILPAASTLIPRLQQLAGPLRIETHSDPRRGVVFYTGVSVPEATVQEAEPDVPAYGTVATPVWLSTTLLVLCALAALAWGFLVAGGRRHRVVAALLERLHPWRMRAAALFGVLFGPDAGEGRWQPPYRFTLAALAGIGILAAGLRLYRLDSLPAGFYCDEAGLGYNVYSILQTGRDETGAFLPLFVWSFDTNFKNPVWIYSALLPIHLLGLNELAVRLTSAFYGIATVIAIFFLGRALMGRWVGLTAALFLAVCPWHLHFSRIAFELITFPFFFILGVTCLVRALQGRRRLVAAALLLGYCVYTYAIAKVFIPLFAAAVAVTFRRELWQRRRETLAAVAVLAITTAPVVLFDLAHAERSRHYFSDTTILRGGKSPVELAVQVADHYARFFSPRFLFTHGDRNVRHTVRGMGELYPLFAPLLLLGIATAFLRRDAVLLLPLWWLALYPLAACLQTEAPSASRGIIGAPAFCLLAAVGLGALLRLAPRLSRSMVAAGGLQLALLAAVLAALAPEVVRYWRLYTQEYPLYSAKYYTGFQYGHREVIEYFLAHGEEYDQMVLTAHLSNQAHIFPLFYGKFPPARFQRDGIEALRRDAKMQVGWVKEIDRFDQYSRLLFAVTEDEIDQLPNHEVKREVIAPDGTPALVLVAFSPGEAFVRSWLVAGPFAGDDSRPPPVSDPEAPAPSDEIWRRFHTEEAAVDLNDFFVPDLDEACAWAVNFVHSRDDRAINVRAGFDDSGDVWINGQRVQLELDRRTDAPLADALAGRAHLRRGRNVVAVHSCDLFGDWYFYLHLTDTEGRTLRGLSWEF